MKDKNANHTMQTLERKQKKAQLKRSDLLKLLLTPLMGGTMPQQERITRAVTILHQERKYLNSEEQAQMEAILYTLAQKFLTTTELEKIKEMMNMTILGEMILQDGIEKGIEKGEKRISHLYKILLDADRLDDLKRATNDQAFQKQLMTELLPEEHDL